MAETEGEIRPGQARRDRVGPTTPRPHPGDKVPSAWWLTHPGATLGTTTLGKFRRARAQVR